MDGFSYVGASRTVPTRLRNMSFFLNMVNLVHDARAQVALNWGDYEDLVWDALNSAMSNEDKVYVVTRALEAYKRRKEGL